MPADVSWLDLDDVARRRLRSLDKSAAEYVGRHLVMVARLLEDDPETAYAHARAAVARAGRIDVVRETAGLAAYRTGRYQEALRELRTLRRLSGSTEHVAVMADCERGLGRPERAIAVAAEEAGALEPETELELAMVVSGARADLGQLDAALAVLDRAPRVPGRPDLDARLAEAKATVLAMAGRGAQAQALLAQAERTWAQLDRDAEIVVYDLTDEEPGQGSDAGADEAPMPPVEAAPAGDEGSNTRAGGTAS